MDGYHESTWTSAPGYRRDALVLAWEGAPVPEGCDRAARVLHATGVLVTDETCIDYTYGVGWIKLLAEEAVARLGGEIVLQGDSDGLG